MYYAKSFRWRTKLLVKRSSRHPCLVTRGPIRLQVGAARFEVVALDRECPTRRGGVGGFPDSATRASSVSVPWDSLNRLYRKAQDELVHLFVGQIVRPSLCFLNLTISNRVPSGQCILLQVASSKLGLEPAMLTSSRRQRRGFPSAGPNRSSSWRSRLSMIFTVAAVRQRCVRVPRRASRYPNPTLHAQDQRLPTRRVSDWTMAWRDLPSASVEPKLPRGYSAGRGRRPAPRLPSGLAGTPR
jgi:hypothetical protein